MLGLLGAADGRADDLVELLDGVLEPVVDDHVAELVARTELLLGDPHPLPHHAFVVGAAPDEPQPQSLERRRRDEDLDRLRQRRANLARPLDLDLEHDGAARGGAALKLGAQRPVTVTGVAGVLDELARSDTAVELLRAQEVVIDAVALARPRRSGRRRY